MRSRTCLVLVVWTCLAASAWGQAQPPRLTPRDQAGALLLLSKQAPDERAYEAFVTFAGGEKAKLLLVGETAPLVEAAKEETLTQHASVEAPEFVEALATATGVWLAADEPLDEGLRGKLSAAQLRGAVIAGAPHVLLSLRDDLQLAAEPIAGKLALEIADDATFAIQGRSLHNSGPGELKIRLAKSPSRAAREITLGKQQSADLHELRRAAWERTQTEQPAIGVPEVKSGALVIVGGGGMPRDIADRFIELGGGDEGRFVVLPTAMDPIPPGDQGAFLKRMGAKHVDVITSREAAELESPETLALLERATAVWFGGGRQWRFVDAYEGTKVVAALHGVLQRGGVIGGSSAGATIQGEYLVRGAPAGPHIMMCEGYERGFAFLPGTAIDQHFAQRNRFKDMTALMKAYPEYLGIGIDEATALVVRGSTAEIMGKGQVHFYDRRQAVVEDQPDYLSVGAGEKYDLKARATIVDEN